MQTMYLLPSFDRRMNATTLLAASFGSSHRKPSWETTVALVGPLAATSETQVSFVK